MSKLLSASYNTMSQSESVIVMGAGPSINNSIEKILAWKKEKNALLIGAHYQYLIKPDYTVFATPAKFRRAQGKIPGKYILGSRIKKHDIRKKYYKKVLLMKYANTSLLNWKEDYFISPSNKIPYDGAGTEAMIISLFCRPSNVLFAGFDGYETHKGKIVIKHSRISTIVKPKTNMDTIPPKKLSKVLLMESVRQKIICKFFRFLVEKIKVNIYFLSEDKLRGIDKIQLQKELPINII